MRGLLLVLLVVVLAAPPVRANMAGPSQSGTPAGEPAADLAGLRIARETLTLDLRALADEPPPDGPITNGAPMRPATVEAVYVIVNGGGPRVLPIEFVVIGEMAGAGAVWLDGAPVAAEAVPRLAVPALWTGITSTPGFDGTPIPYQADSASPGLRYTLAIGPGQHLVRVRYRVYAGSLADGPRGARTWQLGYSLAPARLWAGFGQLDVAVLAPAGWDLATSLPLRAEADSAGVRRVGRFAGVPGDILAVSARAPAPEGRGLLRGLAFVAALAVAGAFGALGGVAVARRGVRARWALPVSLLGGIGAGTVQLALRDVADAAAGIADVGPEALSAAVLVVLPLSILLGTAFAQTIAVDVARRMRRRAPAREPFGPETRN